MGDINLPQAVHGEVTAPAYVLAVIDAVMPLVVGLQRGLQAVHVVVAVGVAHDGRLSVGAVKLHAETASGLHPVSEPHLHGLCVMLTARSPQVLTHDIHVLTESRRELLAHVVDDAYVCERVFVDAHHVVSASVACYQFLPVTQQ